VGENEEGGEYGRTPKIYEKRGSTWGSIAKVSSPNHETNRHDILERKKRLWNFQGLASRNGVIPQSEKLDSHRVVVHKEDL